MSLPAVGVFMSLGSSAAAAHRVSERSADGGVLRSLGSYVGAAHNSSCVVSRSGDGVVGVAWGVGCPFSCLDFVNDLLEEITQAWRSMGGW